MQSYTGMMYRNSDLRFQVSQCYWSSNEDEDRSYCNVARCRRAAARWFLCRALFV